MMCANVVLKFIIERLGRIKRMKMSRTDAEKEFALFMLEEQKNIDYNVFENNFNDWCEFEAIEIEEQS